MSDATSTLNLFVRRAMSLCCAGLLLVSAIHGDEEKTGKGKPGSDQNASTEAGTKKPDPSKKIDKSAKSDTEEVALQFAGEHHPELKTLVESLKTADPAGYKLAIHDLARTHERLSRFHGNKFPERHEHELALWRLDSRIRLAAARSAMKDKEELRTELKSLVEQRQTLNVNWLKSERERTVAQLAKIDADLKAAESNQSQIVTDEVDRVLKSANSKKQTVAATLKGNPNKGNPNTTNKVKKGEMPDGTNPKVNIKSNGEGHPKGDPSPKGGKPGEEKFKGDNPQVDGKPADVKPAAATAKPDSKAEPSP